MRVQKLDQGGVPGKPDPAGACRGLPGGAPSPKAWRRLPPNPAAAGAKQMINIDIAGKYFH